MRGGRGGPSYNANDDLALTCRFIAGLKILMYTASSVERRFAFDSCASMVVFSFKSVLVRFRPCSVSVCFRGPPCWTCIVRRRDKVVVVRPIYALFGRSSQSPSVHL